MLDFPFEIQTFPSSTADAALRRLRRERATSVPILLGDIDVFSAEWAERVDHFKSPDEVLREAGQRKLTFWPQPKHTDRRRGAVWQFALIIVTAIVELVLLPIRLIEWIAGLKSVSSCDRTRRLWSQLKTIEASGIEQEQNLAAFRQTLLELKDEEALCVFPDPVAYVTPRQGHPVAAALVEAVEPWQAAAWLQHGEYAKGEKHSEFVDLCRWLWEQHGARIITASPDHVGFELGEPIPSGSQAKAVLRRFAALGAVEVNGDLPNGTGASLVAEQRIWATWL